MKLSIEQKAEIIHDSARECGLDSHITYSEKRSDLYTMAEKDMGWMGFSKNMPHKNSYLYCDSVDACFYISREDMACVTFAARWFAGSKDLTLERMEIALMYINSMLDAMQSKINKALEGKE